MRFSDFRKTLKGAAGVVCLSLAVGVAWGADLLPVPVMEEVTPAAGRRVKVTEPEYKGTEVYHSLYLPEGYDGSKRYPVIVEYPGNFHPPSGSTGDVGGAQLGYALTRGKDFIWVVLPFISEDGQRNQLTWWGDVDATVAYAKRVVPRIVEQYNGDASAVVLCGFSRGAIAVSFIGLHDDEIAKMWAGLFAHDHFDGVREWPKTAWGSPLEKYRAEAVTRLRRFAGKPMWIGQNPTVRDVREFLQAEGLDGKNVSLVDIPTNEIFPDLPNGVVRHAHTPLWPLADVPQAREARAWLERFKD